MKYLPRIENVGGFVNELSKLDVVSKPHPYKRVWYRGHSTQDWQLAPGVYRPPFMSSASDRPILSGGNHAEKERLVKERHPVQDFRVLSASVRLKSSTDAEIYFLQQHYGMPTRLLDWTINPLAALFFAVKEHEAQDGMVYVMDAYNFTVEFAGSGVGIATWRSPVFQRALGIIFDWRDDVDFEFGILPVRPDHIDPRIGLQQSCFTFHGSACPILTPEANKTLSYMIVPSGHKETIKKQLLLLGVNDFSIFGDLDSLARRLKASYQCG